jgi:4a-hydroxytetrahydrobiopterin dehydratase
LTSRLARRAHANRNHRQARRDQILEALIMQSSKTTLSPEELSALVRELPEWALEDGKLVRFFTFPDFVQAMAFVDRVAQLAEQAGHHPDIDIRYNRVKLALVSHDAGGITARDADMARRLSAVLATPGA